MEADGGSGQAVNKVSTRTGLHIHAGIPVTAIVIEAGTDRQGDDAFIELGVVAVEPYGSVCATVILRYAEGRHGIPGHASEAVPFPRHMAVAKGPAR